MSKRLGCVGALNELAQRRSERPKPSVFTKLRHSPLGAVDFKWKFFSLKRQWLCHVRFTGYKAMHHHKSRPTFLDGLGKEAHIRDAAQHKSINSMLCIVS
jgi:hypothetical protein